VLPFFGLRGDVAVSISILIDFIALGMITFNVYRLWNTNWRYRYLALSVVMVTILLIFLYNDLRHLLQI